MFTLQPNPTDSPFRESVGDGISIDNLDKYTRKEENR